MKKAEHMIKGIEHLLFALLGEPEQIKCGDCKHIDRSNPKFLSCLVSYSSPPGNPPDENELHICQFFQNEEEL